jgi:hypothetical protein
MTEDMRSLSALKNWNGYVPSTGTGELRNFELKWKVYHDGTYIEMSKVVNMTQENWDYLHKYLRLDTDEKKLKFLKNCEENGVGNAIQDQKNILIVEEAYGEAMVISEITKLVPDFSPTAEESIILENTPGGYESYLQALKQLPESTRTNSEVVFNEFNKIKGKLLSDGTVTVELPQEISEADKDALDSILKKYRK